MLDDPEVRAAFGLAPRTTEVRGHTPTWQTCSLGRFVVCTCGWRAGYGNASEIGRRWNEHLDVARTAIKAGVSR